MKVFWNHGQARISGNLLPRDRRRDGPGLNFRPTRFFWHVQQKLAAANIDASRAVPHTESTFLAKARDRFILKCQLTPGLGTRLHGGALANIFVHCRRTR